MPHRVPEERSAHPGPGQQPCAAVVEKAVAGHTSAWFQNRHEESEAVLPWHASSLLVCYTASSAGRQSVTQIICSHLQVHTSHQMSQDVFGSCENKCLGTLITAELAEHGIHSAKQARYSYREQTQSMSGQQHSLVMGQLSPPPPPPLAQSPSHIAMHHGQQKNSSWQLLSTFQVRWCAGEQAAGSKAYQGSTEPATVCSLLSEAVAARPCPCLLRKRPLHRGWKTAAPAGILRQQAHFVLQE